MGRTGPRSLNSPVTISNLPASRRAKHTETGPPRTFKPPGHRREVFYSRLSLDFIENLAQYVAIRHVARRYMSQAPMTEAILLVLMSLAEEPRHGYAIIKDVEQMTTGRVQMSTGTLFGAIQRLLEQGWIQPVEEEESPRGRRIYRLTPVGRRNLKQEFARMKDLTRIGDLRISKGRA